MEHLPSAEEQQSVEKHIPKKRFVTFLKIFFIIILIGGAFSLSISALKFILFPELKVIQEKLTLFSDCMDDIKVLKKEKALRQEDLSKIQEELNDLKQKLDLVHKSVSAVKDDFISLPPMKNIENSANLPYINFIRALKEGADFEEAFKNIAHLKLSSKCLELVGHLQKVYVSHLTPAALKKEFNVLYTKIKETGQPTSNDNIFQRIKNYLINNIHISFKNSNLLLSPGNTLEKAKDKIEKKDIKGALNDMLPLKSLDGVAVWINKCIAYLRVEKLIEKLNKLEERFES
jgi:hypothetical protein